MAKDTVPPPPDFPADGLWGAQGIAAFLFGSAGARETRRVYCLARHSKLPFFRVGGKLCLRRSAIHGWGKSPEETAKAAETVADNGATAGPPEGKDKNAGKSEA